MERNFRDLVKCGLLGATVALGLAACTDDHFDVIPETSSGANSLWENIQSNGETDSLALILSRTYVMKSSRDHDGTQTYGEMLSRPQTFTVWAPKDGTYNAALYLDMLNKRDSLLDVSETPGDSAATAAWQLNYRVANQFLLNHIARFNFESNKELQRVRMLNSKIYDYEASRGLFNSVNIADGVVGIPSSNGNLHLLSGQSPFLYSIYEYMESYPSFSEVWSVVNRPEYVTVDTNYNASTQGAMDENGNMVYVDLVINEYNSILDYTGASLRNEDSLYVAIIPANDAWNEAYATVSSLFKYYPSYAYEWSSERRQFENVDSRAARFNTDSVTQINATKMLLQSSYFTTSRMSIDNQKDSVQINDFVQHFDSLTSTNGTIFYNSNPGGVNPMFNGQAPLKASNGYIYAVNSYKVDPAYSFIEKQELDLRYPYYIATTQNDLTAETTRQGSLVELTSDNRNDSVKGSVKDNVYRRFERNTGNMTVDIVLPNIYSGKYKISAVMVPNITNKANIIVENGKEVVEETVFSCDIIDDLTNRSLKGSGDITLAADTIQEYTLFDSFEFTKCYVGLPSDYADSFPRLRFTLSRRNQQRGNTRSLNIKSIKIEPVRQAALTDER